MLHYVHQLGRAASRLLNALCGGDGATTFSAASWELALAGNAWGRLRVALVDGLPGNGAGHCEAAYAFHVLHGLIPATAQDEAGGFVGGAPLLGAKAKGA